MPAASSADCRAECEALHAPLARLRVERAQHRLELDRLATLVDELKGDATVEALESLAAAGELGELGAELLEVLFKPEAFKIAQVVSKTLGKVAAAAAADLKAGKFEKLQAQRLRQHARAVDVAAARLVLAVDDVRKVLDAAWACTDRHRPRRVRLDVAAAIRQAKTSPAGTVSVVFDSTYSAQIELAEEAPPLATFEQRMNWLADHADGERLWHGRAPLGYAVQRYRSTYDTRQMRALGDETRVVGSGPVLDATVIWPRLRPTDALDLHLRVADLGSLQLHIHTRVQAAGVPHDVDRTLDPGDAFLRGWADAMKQADVVTLPHEARSRRWRVDRGPVALTSLPAGVTGTWHVVAQVSSASAAK